MTKHIFLILIPLIFAFCQGNKERHTIPLNGRHIVWDEQNLKKPWHLSELFDSVRVIPLETNEDH